MTFPFLGLSHKGKAEELARLIVEDWDLDTVILYATEKMFDSLCPLSNEELNEEWKDFLDLPEKIEA